MVARCYKAIKEHFIYNLQNIFYIQLGIFFALIFISLLIVIFIPQESFMTLQDFFEDELMPFFTQDALNSWHGIALNNIRASGIMILYGLLPFIFLPVVSMSANALVVGLLLGMYQRKGMSAWVLFWNGIMPHGMIEIPAIVLASSLGFSICLEFCRVIVKKHRVDKLIDNLRKAAMTYIFVIIPLLILAGIIEYYLTPLLLN